MSHVYDTMNAVTGCSPSSRSTSKWHSSSHFSHWLWYYHHEPSKFFWTLPHPRHGPWCMLAPLTTKCKTSILVTDSPLYTRLQGEHFTGSLFTTGSCSSRSAPHFHPCKSLSLKVASTSSAGMVVHELSMTEECTDSSLRHVWRGLIVLPENEMTRLTWTEAAVNLFE